MANMFSVTEIKGAIQYCDKNFEDPPYSVSTQGHQVRLKKKHMLSSDDSDS